jgi:hypothetical protein
MENYTLDTYAALPKKFIKKYRALMLMKTNPAVRLNSEVILMVSCEKNNLSRSGESAATVILIFKKKTAPSMLVGVVHFLATGDFQLHWMAKKSNQSPILIPVCCV